jgi:hypothetical protein
MHTHAHRAIVMHDDDLLQKAGEQFLKNLSKLQKLYMKSINLSGMHFFNDPRSRITSHIDCLIVSGQHLYFCSQDDHHGVGTSV